MIDTPPATLFDLDAERAALGSILLDRDALLPLREQGLNGADFYTEAHRYVYDAMCALLAQRTPPDLMTVSDLLRRREQLDAVGGVSYLIGLSGNVPTSYHAEHYGAIVQRAALQRRMMQAGAKIARLAQQGGELSDDALYAQAQATLNEAAPAATATGGPQTFAAIANQWYEQLDSGIVPGVPTGLVDLDRVLSLRPGTLNILAARPGNGKSALATQIMYHNIQRGKRVLMYSLEMSTIEIMQRIAANELGIDNKKIINQDLTQSELGAVVGLINGKLPELPGVIDDTAGINIDTIRLRTLRTLATHGKIDLIIVDYLQLVAGVRSRNDNRDQEIGTITKALLALAKEVQAPVLALSQMSRAVEGRANRQPQLSDLRESGNIENDAYTITFIDRPEMYDKDTDLKGIAKLHIAKQRGGALGVVDVLFDPARMRFKNMTHYAAPEGY